MKPWQGVLFGLIFAIIGIALLCFAISSIKTYNEKNKTYIETISKVVDYKYDDEGLQAIVVEYVVNGQTYQKISNSCSNMPKSIGTEVSVKYNPNNPLDAIWTSDSTNFILPIVDVVFTLIGVFVVISSIKNVKKQIMVEEQINILYNNTDVQPQINNVNSQVVQPMNNDSQPTINSYINQPTNDILQSQTNNSSQPNQSVDINNQNNKFY